MGGQQLDQGRADQGVAAMIARASRSAAADFTGATSSHSGPALPPGGLVQVSGRAPVWVYDAAGPPSAPVLMLLHGLGASAALNWFPAFDRLAEHFRVIAPDHRGHGRTPAGEESFSLTGCAEDAFAVADALGIERFIAVGYSMGGPIAQLMWRNQPHRIQGLVLAATSRDFGGRMRDRLTFQSIPLALAATRLPGSGTLRGLGVALLSPRFTAGPLRRWAREELLRGDARRILEAAAELGRFSSRTWIHGVNVPTSVIVAMNDQLVPVRRQLKLARSIDDAVAAFVNGDHYSVGTAPEDFVPVLVHECLSVLRRGHRASVVMPAYWHALTNSSREMTDRGGASISMERIATEAHGEFEVPPNGGGWRDADPVTNLT
jgi:3-oxoadipate enol-lactonase